MGILFRGILSGEILSNVGFSPRGLLSGEILAGAFCPRDYVLIAWCVPLGRLKQGVGVGGSLTR